jgi:uncharacterized membrane protein YbaN (DUF454 family)
MSLYKSLGFIFLGIGLIGVFLPLLPTTPFLLVAAGCFARSSEKWHRWLLSNRIFGPIISDWQERKCISFSTKVIAISLVVLFGGYSVIFLLTDLKLRILTTLLIATGLFFVCRLTVCQNKQR